MGQDVAGGALRELRRERREGLGEEFASKYSISMVRAKDAPMLRAYDRGRLERLALYIASRSANDPKFGKTKLAKILFFSDFVAYTELGDSITGASYAKFPKGPVPTDLFSALDRIEKCGSGAITVADYFGRDQERLVALRPVDISDFSAAEISLVEQVLELLQDDDAAGVSALSHREPAWKYVDDMHPIPYDLAWVSSAPPSDESLRVGQEVAARLGLAGA